MRLGVGQIPFFCCVVTYLLSVYVATYSGRRRLVRSRVPRVVGTSLSGECPSIRVLGCRRCSGFSRVGIVSGSRGRTSV